MTWLDFLTIALCVLIMVIEVKRGAACAIIDTVGIWIALKIATFSYEGISSAQFSRSAAYLTIFLVLVAVTVTISTLVQRQLNAELGPLDSTIACALGVLVGLFFSHIAFGFSQLHFGENYQAYAASAFRGQVYELHALKGFLNFMYRIGSTDVAR